MSSTDTVPKVCKQFGSDHELRKRVRDYLLQCKSPCKSWFRAKEVAQSLDANSRSVGKCMTAIHQNPTGLVRIPEVNRGSTHNMYRVEIEQGDRDE